MRKKYHPLLAIALTVVLIAGAVSTWLMVRHANRQMNDEFLKQARLVAHALNIEYVNKLSGSDTDLQNPDYKKLTEQLTAIKQANEKYRYVYLFGRNQADEIFFFAENETPVSERPIVPGEVYGEASQELKDAFNNGKAFVEGPLPDEWGVWVSALVPIHDSKTGNLIALLGMDIDASDWKRDVALHVALPVGLTLVIVILLAMGMMMMRSRAALNVSEENYRLLFESAGEGIMIIQDDRIRLANPALVKILGYSGDTITTQHLVSIIHSEDRPIVLDRHFRSMEGESTKKGFSFRITAVDGTQKWLEIHSQTISWKDALTSLCFIIDRTEHKRAEEELAISEKKYRELSILDGLTQLYNFRHFYSQLQMEINRADRYDQPLTLLMIDLDNFKAFNDTYGHLNGDEVLSRFGKVIRRLLRQTDSAYRYGGEEFTVLLPMTTSDSGVVAAERIRTEFKKEDFVFEPDISVHMTVSIGVAQYKPGEGIKSFVDRADRLMYKSKKIGKDTVCSESLPQELFNRHLSNPCIKVS